MKTRKYRTFDEYMITDLTENPEQIPEYLQVVLEEYEKDPDEGALLLALRYVIQAQGGVAAFAAKTGIPRESLYRMLSLRGNPTLRNMRRILDSFGYVLHFKPRTPAKKATVKKTVAKKSSQQALVSK